MGAALRISFSGWLTAVKASKALKEQREKAEEQSGIVAQLETCKMQMHREIDRLAEALQHELKSKEDLAANLRVANKIIFKLTLVPSTEAPSDNSQILSRNSSVRTVDLSS